MRLKKSLFGIMLLIVLALSVGALTLWDTPENLTTRRAEVQREFASLQAPGERLAYLHTLTRQKTFRLFHVTHFPWIQISFEGRLPTSDVCDLVAPEVARAVDPANEALTAQAIHLLNTLTKELPSEKALALQNRFLVHLLSRARPSDQVTDLQWHAFLLKLAPLLAPTESKELISFVRERNMRLTWELFQTAQKQAAAASAETATTLTHTLAHIRTLESEQLSSLVLKISENLPLAQKDESKIIFDFVQDLQKLVSKKDACTLQCALAAQFIQAKEFARASELLFSTAPLSREGFLFIQKAIQRQLKVMTPAEIVPFLTKCAANPFFQKQDEVSPADFIGQLIEDFLVRFAGNGQDQQPDTLRLKELLMLAEKMLTEGNMTTATLESLSERRMDGYFLINDFDGAIACLEKGTFGRRSLAWRKGMAAKLRAHKAQMAGDAKEALKQLLLFGEFMQSEEQKDFEDCDPTTGIYYCQEWIVARNFVRCLKLANDLKDTAQATSFRAEAQKFFALAREKVKQDAKSLAELEKEMKSNSL